MPIGKTAPLRARISVRQRMVGVTAHTNDLIAVDLDDNPAGRLTESTKRPVRRHFLGADRYHADMPPSTAIAVPVVQADSSEARYSAMYAISSGVPSRPNGNRDCALVIMAS